MTRTHRPHPAPGTGGGSWRVRRSLRHHEEGVSEIIGFLLVFAIISILLLLGMLAFNKAAEDARKNAIDLRAQSVGTRVASLVVTTSLLGEQQGASTTSVRFLAELPDQLEGASYYVYLEPATGGHVERVRVSVPSIRLDVTAPVFSADAPPTLSICGGSTGTSAPGGHLFVAYNTDAYPSSSCLFLEAAP